MDVLIKRSRDRQTKHSLTVLPTCSHSTGRRAARSTLSYQAPSKPPRALTHRQRPHHAHSPKASESVDWLAPLLVFASALASSKLPLFDGPCVGSTEYLTESLSLTASARSSEGSEASSAEQELAKKNRVSALSCLVRLLSHGPAEW